MIFVLSRFTNLLSFIIVYAGWQALYASPLHALLELCRGLYLLSRGILLSRRRLHAQWTMFFGLLLSFRIVQPHSICLLGGILLFSVGHVNRISQWCLLCRLLLSQRGNVDRNSRWRLLRWLPLSVGLDLCQAIGLLCGLLLPSHRHVDRKPRRCLPCRLLLRFGLVHCHAVRLLCGLLLPSNGHVDRNSRRYLLCRLLLSSSVLEPFPSRLSDRLILPCSGHRANYLSIGHILSRSKSRQSNALLSGIHLRRDQHVCA
jgi:hypothetical protein